MNTRPDPFDELDHALAGQRLLSKAIAEATERRDTRAMRSLSDLSHELGADIDRLLKATAATMAGPHAEPSVAVGDVVRVGNGTTLWQVIEEDGDRLVCLSRRRMQKTHARARLSLVCRQGDPSMTWHTYVCEGCLESCWLGLDHGRRWIYCTNCEQEKSHDSTMLVAGRTDYYEKRNTEHRGELAKQLRLLDDSLAMLEQLGVRVKIEELDEDDCLVMAEHGRGKTTWFVYLDSRLPVARQVGCLGNAWRYMLPANEHRWSQEEWRRDEEDHAMEWFSLSWPHKHALIDDEAIQRALR